MIDFNNDGNLDDEDWILSEIILDEEENEGSKGSKPNGSCLGSVMICIYTEKGKLDLLYFRVR